MAMMLFPLITGFYLMFRCVKTRVGAEEKVYGLWFFKVENFL